MCDRHRPSDDHAGGRALPASGRRAARWNLGLGFIHAAQAVAVLALATAFALPVTASFMEGPPGTQPGAPTTLFDVSVAWGVALFLLLSAAFHWLVVVLGVFGRYTSGLGAQHNYFRWTQYALSSSVIIVLIAMLTGIIYAIFVSLFVFFNIFALNMWLQYRRVGRWRAYVFGERAYFVLSLVAKSLLAWQVFAGTLAG